MKRTCKVASFELAIDIVVVVVVVYERHDKIYTKERKVMKKIIRVFIALSLCVVMVLSTQSVYATITRSFQIRYSFSTNIYPKAGGKYAMTANLYVTDYAGGACSGASNYKCQIQISRSIFDTPFNKTVKVGDGVHNTTVSLKKDKTYEMFFGTATAMPGKMAPGKPYYMCGTVVLTPKK